MEPHLVHRHDPALESDERTMLESWLEYHRATLALKCDGLDDEQLRLRAVPPSNLSLVGLVRHMAEVERWWFRTVLAGEQVDDVYCTPESPDADFDEVDEASGVEAFASWRSECDQARARAAEHTDLADVGIPPRGADVGQRVSLRWIYVHMVEEYARHNGHADLLRERIDGVVGE
ncbi:MAG: DinB family protein [Actinomycetes bacterium]